MPADAYSQVPAADTTAEIDPHWLDLRGSSALPITYLPPSMPGRHSRTTRVVAVVLTGVFLLATAAGVCLTYGARVFGQ
ncbi:MAG: hypothetical protein IPO93_10590 [Actinobacteria bacterium]|jgi:hypothetical protein|nr:hypothetical protein [Actinomycetota bacterium]